MSIAQTEVLHLAVDPGTKMPDSTHSDHGYNREIDKGQWDRPPAQSMRHNYSQLFDYSTLLNFIISFDS